MDDKSGAPLGELATYSATYQRLREAAEDAEDAMIWATGCPQLNEAGAFTTFYMVALEKLSRVLREG